MLAIGTALVHLYLGLQGVPLFVLNGLGYLGPLAALILPVPRISEYSTLVRWVLVGYTVLTIFLWMLVGAQRYRVHEGHRACPRRASRSGSPQVAG